MKIIAVCLLLCFKVVGAELTLERLRMDKRFGVGLSAAGPLSMLGLEIDVNISETLSIGGGIGTGLDYSTLMVKGRYFLLGRSVSPYIGAGFARWWTNGTNERQLKPSVLRNRFLDSNQDLREGFNLFLFYPVLGVQFIHPVGFAVSAELQYLFKLLTMANGTYAGLSAHWYF